MIQVELKNRIDEDICLLLQIDNHPWRYMCDCGTASGLSVKECQQVAALFVSHTHIDHFVNFDTLLRHQIGVQREITICGPIGIAKQVQSKILGYTWNLIEKGSLRYQIREIVSENEIQLYTLEPPTWELVKGEKINAEVLYENKAMQVHFTILDHGTPSIAYLFQEPDKINIDISQSGLKGGAWIRELKQAYEAGKEDLLLDVGDQTYTSGELFSFLHLSKGYKLGVIMDHAANKENHDKIKSLFSDSDKIYIECFYQAADKAFAEANHHSYSSASGKIMKEAFVKEAIPVHFSRKYDEKEIATIVEEFELARRP